jgi:carboxyl-terminal processing protease
MARTRRDILLVVLVIGLFVLSFGAGFLANEALRNRGDHAGTFPNGDDLSIFWEAWGWVEKSYLGALPSSEQATYGAVRGALATLGDPYTVFVEPVDREAERTRLRGNFGGIGATLTRDGDGNLLLEPLPGNPAEAAGILSGDLLLKVDGVLITTEMTIADIAELIRGEEGTEVTLEVLHPGEDDPVEVIVVRAVILLPSVSYRVLEEDPEIGYIMLSRFSAESAGEVQAALEDLLEQGVGQVVLDLRHNGGGLLDAAVDVSDLFLDEGPVVYQVSRDEDERMFNSTDETIASTEPLVVLVDGGTASAAEIVAGALSDRGRATLIGSRTFGKGSVQLVYDLSDGSSVHVTSARWYTPDRRELDQQGIEPDIAVEVTQEAIEAGRDETLLRAVDYLQGIAAQ